MCRIADQRDTRRNQPLGMLQHQRKPLCRRNARQPPEARRHRAARRRLDRAAQRIRRQREQVACVVLVGGPHHRHAPVRQRQHGEDLAPRAGLVVRRARALGRGAEEPLPRGVLVPVLGLEVGDHAQLAVRLCVSGDTGLLAHPRLPAVGADHAFGADRLPIGQRQAHGIGFHLETCGGMGEGLYGMGEPQRSFQRALDQRRLGNPRQLRRTGRVGGEMQIGVGVFATRGRLVAEDAHVLHRLHARHVQRRPDAQLLEQRLRAGRERIDTGVPGLRPGRHRHGRGDGRHVGDAQADLRQPQRARAPDDAAAHHRDVKSRRAGGGGKRGCIHGGPIIAAGGGPALLRHKVRSVRLMPAARDRMA